MRQSLVISILVFIFICRGTKLTFTLFLFCFFVFEDIIFELTKLLLKICDLRMKFSLLVSRRVRQLFDDLVLLLDAQALQDTHHKWLGWFGVNSVKDCLNEWVEGLFSDLLRFFQVLWLLDLGEGFAKKVCLALFEALKSVNKLILLKADKVIDNFLFEFHLDVFFNFLFFLFNLHLFVDIVVSNHSSVFDRFYF